MSTLSSQMTIAYEAHRDRANALLSHYRIVPPEDTLDDFQHRVQHNFLAGVHEAFQTDILTSLHDELGSQQRIAEVLGLKDRSSISQMNRSKTMDGIRVTAALYQFPEIPLPSRDRAALFGFARASAFIKACAYRDQALEGSMRPQQFSYLVGLLANADWGATIRDVDPERARRLAQQIVTERTIARLGPPREDGSRPEQLVLMLQDLWLSWAEFGILALWAIPECIPETKEA